jgi:hypothetical protein
MGMMVVFSVGVTKQVRRMYLNARQALQDPPLALSPPFGRVQMILLAHLLAVFLDILPVPHRRRG